MNSINFEKMQEIIIKRVSAKYRYLSYDLLEDAKQVARSAIYEILNKKDLSTEKLEGYIWVSVERRIRNEICKNKGYSKETYSKNTKINKLLQNKSDMNSQSISLKQIQKFRKIGFVSLDSFLNDNITYLDTIYDDDLTPLQKTLINGNIRNVNIMLSTLSEEENILLRQRYGIGCAALNLTDLAKKYNMTHQGISSKINKIISRLKSKANIDDYYFLY